VFYSRDPLLGTLLSTALSNQYNLESEGQTQVTLQVEPYFFLTRSATSPNISYNWQMNGSSLNPSGDKNTITLRRQGNVGGEADVRVEIEDKGRLFPSARSSIDIVF